MKKLTSKIFILALVFSLILTGCGNAKAENGDKGNKTIDAKLQDCVKGYYNKNKFIGAALVSKDNKTLLNTAYGMADDENHIKNSPGTIYSIAAITCQFTAASILMLQEKNLLNLQDTIDKYIPDYPNGNKIKIFNLLTNTSGIYEYLNNVDYSGGTKYTPVQLIEIFKNKPLSFDPGTKFDYSNSNFVLLGYIIEKVSGMKYEDYVNKNILKPLNMDNTGFLNSGSDIKGKAVGYLTGSYDNKLVYTKSMGLDVSVTYAGGEMYSTVGDLYKWYKGLASEKVIKKESLDQMFTPYSSFNYGLGCNIKKNSDGSISGYRCGFNNSYTAYNEINIKKNYTIIILSNQGSSTAVIKSMADDLQKILEGKN